MAKNINVVLTLQDKFTSKMSLARYQAQAFKSDLALMQLASEKAGNAMHSMENVVKKTISTTLKIATVGAGAIATISKSSLNSYYEYEKALNNSAAIREIEAQSEAYYKLNDSIKETVKTVKGATYTEGSTAIGYAFLAGWSEQEGLSALPALLKGMKISGEDPATVADALTDSMSALGLKPEQAEEYIDMATRIQALTNTNMLQVQNALIKSGSGYEDLFNGTNADDSMKIAKELMIVAGLLANVGKKGEEAGTIINSMFTRMTKSTGETADGLEKLGVKLFDEQGGIRPVAEIFRDMAVALEPMTDEQRAEALSLVGGRYRSQLTTIIDAFYELDEAGKTAWNTVIDGMENTKGAADKYLDTIYSGYSGNVMLLQSKWENFKISAGEILAPYVTQFIVMLEEKLPDLEAQLEVMPDYLEAGKEKLIEIKENIIELIDKVQPFFSWLWEHKGGLATAFVGTYAGLGAFRLAVEGATAYDNIMHLGNALKKRASAKEKAVTRDLVDNAFNLGTTFDFSWLKEGEILDHNQPMETSLMTGLETFYYTNQLYNSPNDKMNWINDLKKWLGVSVGTTTATASGGMISKIAGLFSGGTATEAGFASIVTGMAKFLGIVGAVATALIEAYKYSDKFAKSVKKIGREGQGVINRFCEPFRAEAERFNKIGENLGVIWENSFSIIGDVLSPVVDDLSNLVEGLGYIIGATVKVGLSALADALDLPAQILADMSQSLKDLIDNLNILENKKNAFAKWIDDNTDEEKQQEWQEKHGASVGTSGAELYTSPLSFLIGDWLYRYNKDKQEREAETDNGPSIVFNPDENALGTNYFSGGWTKINEAGAEMVNLPTGTSIVPANSTKNLLKDRQKSYVINVNIDKFYGDDERYINNVANRIAGKLASVM